MGMAQALSLVSRPTGLLKIQVNVGESKPISIPLADAYVYAGTVSTAGADRITTTGAGWAVNAYGPLASNPHLVRFTTGGASGQHYRITSHTADTLIIQTGGLPLNSLVSAGDQYEVVPADTLARLFGADARPAGVYANADSQQADNVMIRGTAGVLTFFNDGVSWYRVGTSSPQNAMVLMPENGFIYVRRGATPFSFSVNGQTPVTNLATEIPAGRTTLIANRFPIDTTLNSLGLHLLPGWLKGADSSIVDNVLLYASGQWKTYYHNGANWLLVGNPTAQDPAISTGSSIVIVKRPGSNVTLNQPRPYAVE